ncbi:hypothetical protein LTR56_017678 [Elasticomyces elasticus]|nr:hypothetical protein LTR56_017678 [Elasticomyces elasticus]KAK3643779.1 hypothetical protein LTR22_015515 [Elasticomyces elasticus]KAK4912985.1 hypothetical protein LTR49_018632 [Elasticomyces elasticus]KAK5752392.1 hypothetical protein LTS12_017523 [Elasticomyces elasticus]
MSTAKTSKVMASTHTPWTTTATPLPTHPALAVHATNTTMLNCSTLIGENRIACFSLLNETAYYNTLGVLWDEIDGSWLDFWVYIGNYVVFLVVYILPALAGSFCAVCVGYLLASAIFYKRPSKRTGDRNNNHAAEDVGGQMDGNFEQPVEQAVPGARKTAEWKYNITLFSPMLLYITLVVSAVCGALGSSIKELDFVTKCMMAVMVLMPIGLVGVVIFIVRVKVEKKKASKQAFEMSNL